MLGRRSATACGRVVNTSTGGAIYGEGADHPGPRGPPGRARGALRPVEVLRRALLRALHPPARAVDRLAALRQRLRPAPGPARRGRRDRDLLRQAARGRQAHDLRRRPSDARLRLRRRRGRGQPARRRTRRRPAPFNIGRGVQTSVLDIVEALARALRERLRARARSPSGPARCSTSPSTARAREASSAGRRRSTSTRGSSARSPRFAMTSSAARVHARPR